MNLLWRGLRRYCPRCVGKVFLAWLWGEIQNYPVVCLRRKNSMDDLTVCQMALEISLSFQQKPLSPQDK